MQTVNPAIRVKSHRDSQPFYAAPGFLEQRTHRFEAHG